MMWQRMVALALRQRQFSGGICHSGTAALSNPCDLHSKPSFEPTQGLALAQSSVSNAGRMD